ncbi:aspartyl-phosphate phosphatase Spo0E family protein [Tumebacillus sp. ITR2]|uniref:Aspartyl-phosphate phosphatase Spo0E family protein n=1 Tax=Tumebacillus amylolyticus TaxID=2801339 RepID=A0ABS1JEX3_9BACL|nr:aspartyl-phosphate phosphatase Spo0E family protein [Tumebacillus amylolyticus]MBL0388841.1 aspartyl-phosphate phosphatase Spo0E family protein [Tumebacillus amylolyticus]
MNGIAGQIESLRQQLLEMVDSCSGDFLHPHVLRVSQELDELIVQFQRLQVLEHKSRRELSIYDACLSEASGSG